MLLNTIKKLMVFFMCTQPIQRVRQIGNKTITDILPCGHCAECIKRDQNGIVVRAIEESRKTGRMVFITLTYSNENLTYSEYVDETTGEIKKIPTLHRADIKEWKREVRKAYFRNYACSFPKFSYIICGEYGPKSFQRTGYGRPHYHGLIFGLDRKHCNILQKYWQDHFGFACFKRIPLSVNGHDDISCVARYVSKYCVKPEEIENPFVKKKIIEKPRKQTSIGFGLPLDLDERKKYWLMGYSLDRCPRAQDIDTINSRLKYEYNGCNYSLPLYYRKKILYEKGFKGNLVASSLSKVLASSLQRRAVADFNSELRSVVSGKSEREANEAVFRLCEAKKDSDSISESIGREDLFKSYKSSAF